jgi:signal transduction histidine kinase
MAWEESGVRGHITSLNPIRSGNTPDPWEAAALKSFEKGEQEFSSIEELGGADYMRLMRPFVTEERCLKCHARQGYQVGQIRGGISVAVPMAPLRPKAAKLTLVLALGHGLVWLVGMIFLHVGGRRLAENAEELEEANRSKELFTDILSHDLRNPTGAVLGYTEILLHDEKDDERRSLLERVRGSSQKLMEMLESAALYSKLDALDRVERKEVDLGVLVGRSVTDLEKTLEEKNVVVRGVPEAPLPAQASPLIENVFSNLLSNAVKFSPEEGSVEILSEEVDGSWVVAFRDHGPGIPPELRARLFTRFERLDSERAEGIGLGLAIARRLVELHRGAIWVEETPGGGSTFFVRLPKEG